MTKTTRYQVTDVISKRGKCRTHTGVDPVTGLPVLIYIFEGRPRVTVGRLEADTIPSILAARFNSEKNKGQVVVAHSEERQQIDRVASQDEAQLLLLDTAKALAAAASAKVVHGDIYPGRFWTEAGHYWLEGYGVNWHGGDERFSPPEQSVSLQGDVFSWAQSVYDMAGHAMPRAMTKLLATCLADDPEQRPTAGSLLEQLQALADGATTTTSQAPARSAPADTDTSSDAARSAASDASLSMENFDLNFEDDDTATFAVSESATGLAVSETAPDTDATTEAHGPMASASRLADFDLGSFADEDDEDDDMMPASGSAAGDYDFFAAGDEDDDTDLATGGSVDTNDTNDLGQAFEADFGEVTFADTAGDTAGDDGDSDYGDDGFADDFSEDALVSRDDGAFQVDAFASTDDTDDMDDSASFASFDDDFADEPVAGGGLSDLSDIMAPANNPAANAPTSDQPIAKADAGEFIKGLPTGATVRTVESKKKAPAQELPASKQAKVYTPPSKRKKRNLGRKIGVVALVTALGVLVFVALDRYGVLNPPPPPNPVATFFPLNVSVRPESIAQAQLVVVSSPEGSVHDAGDEMATVPARVFLDSEGTWQLRARFQDALSEVQTLTVPGPNAVTFEIPVPEENLEPPPN